MSPLYDLQYGTVKLKQYASKIRQAVVSAVTANSSTKYVVQIEEHANLKYSEDDASALIVSIPATNISIIFTLCQQSADASSMHIFFKKIIVGYTIYLCTRSNKSPSPL